MSQTTADLVSAVRAQLDETNTATVKDDGDIYPSLNRAQDYAANVLARHYPEPLLTSLDVPTVAGQATYSIPEDCYEDRLLKVELENAGRWRELDQITYRELSDYDIPESGTTPSFYAIVGRNYRLVPKPTRAWPLRIWYLRTPDKLIPSQGRIVLANVVSNYVVLDAPGTDMNTSTHSYVNIVDGSSGLIKGTLQIQSIVGSRITFRSAPLRLLVQGRTILTALTDEMVDTDDYLALVEGTCVPQALGGSVTNFIIQYAVNEITRKLGGETIPEDKLLGDLETQLQKAGTGRQSTLRVAKRAGSWRFLARWM